METLGYGQEKLAVTAALESEGKQKEADTHHQERIQYDKEELVKAESFAQQGDLLGILYSLFSLNPIPKVLNRDMLDLLVTASIKHEEITGEHSPHHMAFRFMISRMTNETVGDKVQSSL